MLEEFLKAASNCGTHWHRQAPEICKSLLVENMDKKSSLNDDIPR